MSKYDFYIAQLRFVVNRTERESEEVACMMDALGAIIDALEGGDENFFVPAFRLRSTARALAGVAGFMQQHILPEVVAAQNGVGEKQVRWTIETCMTWMANLMTHAELTKDADGLTLSLPPLD
ncbi:MAG TPA: hypothetical protein VIN57_03780 [Magnetovibrio sp.]